MHFMLLFVKKTITRKKPKFYAGLFVKISKNDYQFHEIKQNDSPSPCPIGQLSATCVCLAIIKLTLFLVGREGGQRFVIIEVIYLKNFHKKGVLRLCLGYCLIKLNIIIIFFLMYRVCCCLPWIVAGLASCFHFTD